MSKKLDPILKTIIPGSKSKNRNDSMQSLITIESGLYNENIGFGNSFLKSDL